jgi:hypothetical protein
VVLCMTNNQKTYTLEVEDETERTESH